MTGDRLRELAQASTPGPWHADDGENDEWNVWDSDGVPASAVAHDVFSDANRRLIALAPDMAVLLADAIDALADYHQAECGCHEPGATNYCVTPSSAHHALSLLARFRALGDHT